MKTQPGLGGPGVDAESTLITAFEADIATVLEWGPGSLENLLALSALPSRPHGTPRTRSLPETLGPPALLPAARPRPPAERASPP